MIVVYIFRVKWQQNCLTKVICGYFWFISFEIEMNCLHEETFYELFIAFTLVDVL